VLREVDRAAPPFAGRRGEYEVGRNVSARYPVMRSRGGRYLKTGPGEAGGDVGKRHAGFRRVASAARMDSIGKPAAAGPRVSSQRKAKR